MLFLNQKIPSEFPSLIKPFIENLLKNNRKYVLKKKINYLINKSEQKLHTNCLISLPYQAVLDPTNICNLRCPLCPTWQDMQARPKGRIDMNLYKKILDELGPYLFTINLCNWGEPFLNPDLPEMIEYAKRYNTVVGLSTNLNHLPDRAAENVINSAIDIIVISLDGVTQEAYSKYRIGGDVQKVFENIEKLSYYIKREDKKTMLVWQYLVNRYNETQLKDAEKIASELGIIFQPSPMRSSMGKELLLPLHERVQEMKEWLPENPDYRKYQLDIEQAAKTKQTTCKWLWDTMVINWDGSISPCCGVFEKKWDFGNITLDNKSSPRKAWNSLKYILARRLVAAYYKKSKKLPSLIKLAQREGLICLNCLKYGFLED